MKHSQAATGQSQAWMEQLQADQTNAGCPHAASHTQQLSHVHQPPHLVHTDSSQLSRQTLLYIRISLQKTFELRLSHIQSHRLDFNIMSSDQLWLFSLTSEAVSVLGWKHVPTEPWTTAWLILMRAVDKFYSRGKVMVQNTRVLCADSVRNMQM